MYEYACQIISIHDGDTLHASVDFGCDLFRRMTFRLYGINAPELNTPQGKEARAFLAALLDGKSVTVHTVKDRTEKYGRYLGSFFIPGDPQSVNEKLVASGHAVPYMP